MTLLIRLVLFATCLLLIHTGIYAQQLEPRSLSSVPIQGNFAVMSYGYSTGNILINNNLPIEDLTGNFNNVVVGYVRTFKFLNRQCKADVILPYSFGKYEAIVEGVDTFANQQGFLDPSARFAITVIGDDPVPFHEFSKIQKRKFKLGTSIRVRAPFSQYNDQRLLNLGTNRWSTRIGIAGSYIIKKRLIIEGQFNSWFFTINDNFYNGNTLKQSPLIAGQLHTIYIISKKMWVSASAGATAFGHTFLNNIEQTGSQNNSRYGFSFSYRVAKMHAIKLSYSSGITIRYGANFSSLLLAYQLLWFDKKK